MAGETEDHEVVDALALGTEDSPVELTESGLKLNLTGPGEDEPAPEVVEHPVTPEDLKSLAALEAEWAARPANDEPNPSLDRVRMLMDILGAPHRAFQVIQVAGTNGKTSTARMIDSLLRAFHRRVGLFTSPELNLVTECVVIDGKEIHPADFVAQWEEIRPYVAMVDEHFTSQGGAPLSHFEILVAIAFAAFADAPVDIAVVEVGMGGTWDATNVVNSEVAAITPVGLDHQRWLGESLEEIAAQKAGIIKPRDDAEDFATPAENIAVVGLQEPAALHAILEAAVAADAGVARQGQEFGVAESRVAVGGQSLTIQGLGGTYDEVFVPLSGEHQAHNAAHALAVVEAFFGVAPGRPLDAASVRNGFASLRVPGRLERVHTGPIVFVDSAHNPHGVRSLAAALDRDFNFQSLTGVVGVLSDKDAAEMLRLLEPVFAEVIITQSTSPRAMDAYELAALAREVFGDERVRVEERLVDAVDAAIAAVDEAELDGQGIVATGSITVAGQARAMFVKD